MTPMDPTAAGAAVSNSVIERLGASKGKTLEAEKERLKKATQEFEAFFTHYMLKTMRETIPDSPFEDEGMLSSSNGKDIFTDLFDMEVARQMAGGGSRSIGDMLYNSMLPLIEAEYGVGSDNTELNPLNGSESIPIELNQDEFRDVESEEQPIGLPESSSTSISITPQTTSGPLDTAEIISQYGRHIRSAARENEIDPALITAVIKAESNGDASAVSKAGAKGLMQLVDSTATDMDVTEVFDPKENIAGGSRYLKKMIDRFGDTEQALAAYNAGPENVKKYGGVPPYRETQEYVEKVMTEFRAIRKSVSHSEAKVQ
ncbi:MAG TPA: transglycosylase SLT domain-containing protein [candidate division Zixibacteria bacterium]|nr:transglycosylase SLT domain-containing protein [candidate division Zixibacteria bacterium]